MQFLKQVAVAFAGFFTGFVLLGAIAVLIYVYWIAPRRAEPEEKQPEQRRVYFI